MPTTTFVFIDWAGMQTPIKAYAMPDRFSTVTDDKGESILDALTYLWPEQEPKARDLRRQLERRARAGHRIMPDFCFRD